MLKSLQTLSIKVVQKIHFCRWIFIFQMESQKYLMEEFICMAQRMSLTESIAVISFMYIQHLYQI